MKILLDARTVGKRFSGVGNYVLELVRALGRLDEDLHVHLCVRGPSRLRDLSLDARFRLLEAPFSHENHPLGDLWEDLVLPRRARSLGVDVLHGPAFLIPTRATDAARVVTIHDLVAFTHPKTIPRKYALYMRWLIRRAVGATDRIITVSESVREDVIRRLKADPERVDCIRLGVSERFTPPDEEEVARVRRAHALHAPYLLFVGNLEPRKNLPGLVEAFRRVVARHDGPLDLAVAGQVAWKSDALLPAMRARDVSERVRALGYVPPEDLPALYAGAEVFVFPTFWEGFGLPVLEAMACGAPVVASRVASIPEVAGDAAVLVDPESPDSISEAILRVLTSPELRDGLRRQGRERAIAFTWEQTARATLTTYRAALAGVAS
jgi:glycosyltransferase involved in cell wall biosynthesis